MAATLVNLTGYQVGIQADETGINIESFEVTYKPEAKEYQKDRLGQKIGFSVLPTEAEISVEGQVNSALGLMAATFTTAVTLANVTNAFGPTTGGIYLDSVSLKQSREPGKMLSASFKFSKIANIT